jgi:hypothetical protein
MPLAGRTLTAAETQAELRILAAEYGARGSRDRTCHARKGANASAGSLPTYKIVFGRYRSVPIPEHHLLAN